MRLFLDANVLLDVLLARQPFVNYTPAELLEKHAGA